MRMDDVDAPIGGGCRAGEEVLEFLIRSNQHPHDPCWMTDMAPPRPTFARGLLTLPSCDDGGALFLRKRVAHGVQRLPDGFLVHHDGAQTPPG